MFELVENLAQNAVIKVIGVGGGGGSHSGGGQARPGATRRGGAEED
jgi:hypothetical protein